MKTILNTIYITNPNRYLSLDGENVVILEGNEEIGRTALHRISGIITFGYAGVSPALMKKCTSYGIAISFMSQNGRFLGRVVGEQNGNVLLRKEQYRISDDETRSLDIAKSFIIGKLYNSRWVIERVTRDHSLSADVDKLKHASSQLFNLTKSVLNCESLNSLRGLEGDGASIYFGVFDEMIIQQKNEFQFNWRNKRPPLDPVNSMLSYVYTLLAHETAAAAEAAGLDAYVGFLHRDRPGRLSLGLDLMEEFRSVLADRFVLCLLRLLSFLLSFLFRHMRI